jgi:phosphodiesterase/alkaline phosphatase D-like protein
MKLSLAFVFISVLAVCIAVGQSESTNKAAQNSAMSSSTTSTQDQAITNGPVAEYISDSNCTIGWSTNAPGEGMMLRYGTDRNKMTQTAEVMKSKNGPNYHVRLDGLAPTTRYYFRVLDGGEPISGIGTFQTVAHSDPPVRSKAVIPQ